MQEHKSPLSSLERMKLPQYFFVANVKRGVYQRFWGVYSGSSGFFSVSAYVEFFIAILVVRALLHMVSNSTSYGFRIMLT